MSNPAVFLDRDGTMIHEIGYLSRLADVRWFPYTIDAIRLLNRAGFRVVVVTNQGGVGLGLFDEAFVQHVHETLAAAVLKGGATVDAWHYCPHHPRAVVDALRVDCLCRKPRPGLVRAAEQAFDLDLAASYVIGDRALDVDLATAVGAQGILVRTGHGEGELARQGGAIPGAALVAANLMEATAWILRERGHPREAA